MNFTFEELKYMYYELEMENAFLNTEYGELELRRKSCLVYGKEKLPILTNNLIKYLNKSNVFI